MKSPLIAMRDDRTSLLEILGRVSSEDDLLAEVAILTEQTSGANSCNYFILDHADALVLRGSNVAPELCNRFRVGKGKGISGVVVQSGEPLFLNSGVEDHPKYVHFPGIDECKYEAIAVIPLQITDQPLFGVVALKWVEPRSFSSRCKATLIKQANYVSATIKGFEKAYNAGAQMNRLGALSEVAKIITSSPYLEEILQLLVNLTAQQFNYKVCTVRLLDEERQELVLRATQAPAKAYQRKRAIKLGESIAGKAIAENRPIIVPDVAIEDDYIGHDLAAEQGLKSMICIPLSLQEKPVGVISCYTAEVHDFGDDEIAALETLAKQAAFAIEHAKLQVRDTLMQEMHHRVKNNLQQVASLMRLQLRHGQYKSLEEALNDTLARILAIASVHDLLSREDLDHVDIRSIVESLVQHQLRSLILPDKTINFKICGDYVKLNMNQGTQVALVINELILNSVEHGFHRANEGDVHITIEEREGDVSLWVSNNGDQLPAGFDPAIYSHLGLQIVENLTGALGGKFKLNNILGWTVAEVKFPIITSE